MFKRGFDIKINKQLMSRSIVSILLVSITTAIFGQYKYTFKSPNYANDTLIIGAYVGDKQLVKDTLLKNKNKAFVMEGKDTLSKGFYLGLIKPSNYIFQFIINNESQFEITFDTTRLNYVEIKNSKENEIYYDYLEFLNKKRAEADKLREIIAQKQKSGQDRMVESKALDKLDEEVKAKQKFIITTYPKSATTLLINTVSENIEIPKELQADTSTAGRIATYHYYKARYFNEVDFKSPMLINNSFGFKKIDDYFTRLVSNESDSIIKEFDIMLEKLKGNEDAVRFLLPHWLNKYGNGKVIGHDAIYVHLIDNYFKKGWTPWIEPSRLETLYRYADDWRPTLIGKNFPKIITFQKRFKNEVPVDSIPLALYNVDAPYTLLVFWAHDCGHCSKSMPYRVKWEEKYRPLGVKVFGVCTNAYDKEGGCWPAIKEKNMQNFINTSDYYQGYRRMVSIPQTPKLFILDKDKKILFKEFDAEKIDLIFEEILKLEGKKS
jgi:thiol-disulfide isomerase/thioredoxin